MSSVNDQLVGIADHLLLLGEEARDDAGDLTAVIERRACHLAHQAEAAAAVDEADVVRGELRAERGVRRPCRLDFYRGRSRSRRRRCVRRVAVLSPQLSSPQVVSCSLILPRWSSKFWPAGWCIWVRYRPGDKLIVGPAAA